MKHNWEYKKLGAVCEITSARRVHQSDWKDTGIPFYRAREIVKLSNDGYVENELFISNELYEELSKTGKPEAGDIMVSAVGTLGATYIVKQNDLFYYKDASVICLSKIKEYNPKFICYLFGSNIIKEQISKQAKGATVGTITISNASKFNIPHPPIAIQGKIVQELDEINGMIIGRKEQLRLLDQLAQSIFYEMFGDPITNPKGWEVKKLGKLCDSDLGKTLNSKTDTGKLYPYLCAINIQWNKIDTATLKQTKFEEEELERYTVKKGDLLVCEGGDVGRSAIWKSENNILYQNALHRLRFKGEIIPYFCLFVMKIFKDQGILDTKYSKGITIKHLVKSSLVSIPFIVPPIKLQDEFAAKIDLIEEQKKDIENSIKELETLLASRMDYWFN